MAKKKQTIQLEGLADLNFDQEPDIAAAQSVIETPEPVDEPPVKSAPNPKKAVQPKAPAKKAATAKREPVASPPSRLSRSTFPPEAKKRATFNIDEDLHRALKDFSYFEEIDMVEYIFDQLVKPDLAAKGFYPPKKKKR